MKISYNWLKDYVDVDKTPQELANDLSMFGFAKESIDKVGSDTVLDLEINPNRGDVLSILGIAREIAALYNLKIKSTTYELQSKGIDKNIKVKITEPKICPRFTARIIENIKIKDSPLWLKERLATYGFRPISNIVDITNYVMIATGQPIHAFDFEKINAGQMEITQAKGDEELMTLDGQNRILPAGALIIRDSQKIYDLAGIMGGSNSEVDNKTKTIVLQGAIFDPVLIRRTSKKLNHLTDASYRYERGVDYEGTIFGVDMAAQLIYKTCPDAKIGNLIDIKSQQPKDVKISLNLDKINKLLGTDLSLEKAKEYLERLNFQIAASGNLLAISVPSYRQYDVKIWQDLAEEIARIYGFNKIKSRSFKQAAIPETNKDWLKREIVKDILKDLGFTEVMSLSFIDKEKIELLGFKTSDCQEVQNPLSEETRFLRPTLVSSLLDLIAKNPWSPEIAIFEVGKILKKYGEKWQVGMATVGNSENFLMEAMKRLSCQGEIISLNQEILDFYKIRRPVKVLIFDLEGIEIKKPSIKEDFGKICYREISKYPPTVRDLAFIVHQDILAKDIQNEIIKTSQKILLVELFDEFESDKFGKDNKNVAFHVWLEDLSKPMAEEDVNLIIKSIIKKTEEEFKAKIRDY